MPSQFLSKVNAQQTPEVETATNEIWAKFSHAWEAEDAKACAEFYSANGINIPPEQKIKTGRGEIATSYDFLFSLHESSIYNHSGVLEVY